MISPEQLQRYDAYFVKWNIGVLFVPGELVFDPFVGIGSVVYEAVKWNRRGLGIELKKAYYDVAIRNCKNAEKLRGKSLLDLIAEKEQSEVAGD